MENAEKLEPNKENLSVESNWILMENKNIYDSISVLNCEDYDPAEDISIGAIVSLQSCILLQKSSNETCTFTISSTLSSVKIQLLHIVSGSKYVELYTGKMFEYIDTFKGELFDDFENTLIYKAKIQLNDPVTHCMLKFVNISCEKLWIYGLLIIVKKSEIADSTGQCLKQSLIDNKTSISNSDSNMSALNIIVNTMKEHIDNKFLELENRLTTKLNEIENNQNKLKGLIENLEKMITSSISLDKLKL